MKRWIAHSDCDFFYANVEQFRHPELRGKPIAVGGDAENRHGIILTANPLAKQCGVKTGMALWQAKQLCSGLVIVPPNYNEYKRYSDYCREIYADYTDQYEAFGLDENWLDLSASAGLFGSPLQLVKEIQQRVWKELGITVSIGLSYNKIAAKLGSDYQKPNEITYIPPDQYQEIVYPLPVSDLLMVGKATTNKLMRRGIRTIGALAQLDVSYLRSWFGKYGEMLSVFARGEDRTPVAVFDERSIVKSIGNSTTTPRDLVNNEDVKIILFVLAESVARRMREHGFKGRIISISIRDNQLHNITRQCKQQKFTNLSSEIAESAYRLFVRHYRWEHDIRSLGISVSDFEHDNICVQTDLFSNEQKREQLEQLERTLDRMRYRYGTDSIQRASMLTDPVLSGFDPYTGNTIHPVSFL